jgi:hypothetical protein
MTTFVDPKFGTGATTNLQTRRLPYGRVPPARVRMEQGRLFVFPVLDATLRYARSTPERYPPHSICEPPPEIHGPACSGLGHLFTKVTLAVVWSTTSEFRALPLRQASSSPAPLLGTSTPETNLPPGM